MESCLSFELSQLGEPALTLDESAYSSLTLTGNHSVRFPMAKLLAMLDGLWSLVDGNTAWDMAFGVPVAVTKGEPPPVVTDQARNQISGLSVNPLVDGFGTNGLLRPQVA